MARGEVYGTEHERRGVGVSRTQYEFTKNRLDLTE